MIFFLIVDLFIFLLCIIYIDVTQGIRENFAHYKNVTDEHTIKEVKINVNNY